MNMLQRRSGVVLQQSQLVAELELSYMIIVILLAYRILQDCNFDIRCEAGSRCCFCIADTDLSSTELLPFSFRPRRSSPLNVSIQWKFGS